MDQERNMVIFCLLLAAVCSPVFTEEWKASVIKNLDALVSSCVVVPCSFSHPGGSLGNSRLRAIWHHLKDRKERIYYEDNSQVLESYRGRTRLLGHLSEGNCTLEITEVKDYDNGPFCFRIELAKSSTDMSSPDKFSFVEQCVELKMLPDPPKPKLNHPKTAIQDHPFTVTCSVIHTCPSHAPMLQWSRGSADEITETHSQLHLGYWQTQSILTFVPGEKDDHKEVTCTAEFNGKETSSETLTIYVKRKENYNHIIIPTVVGIVTAVIFGVVCIFMVKKYKRRIAELQSQDGSMWNRLSRLSRRIRHGGPGQIRSDQRRPKEDMLNSGHMTNDVKSKSNADQKISKPRFPSPKSQPKSFDYREDLDDGDDYINTADLNVYGNI